MAAVGMLFAHFRKASPSTLAQAVLYVFSPALTFHSLATTEIPPSDVGYIALFSLVLLVLLYILAWAGARALGLDRKTSASYTLTVLFMNSGNYGIPVALLAFGQDGMDRAIVLFVVQAVLGGTVGVFIASRGSRTVLDALKAVVKMPMGYAAMAGLAVNVTDIALPPFLGQTTDILGQAAVPGMLIVLGIQLYQNFRVVQLRVVSASVFSRLILSVGLAYLATLVLGIGGLTQQVLIVVSGMPAAVFVTILATEFDARPDLATSSVLAGTLASMLTLTVLLSFVA
jgi:predicted permease